MPPATAAVAVAAAREMPSEVIFYDGISFALNNEPLPAFSLDDQHASLSVKKVKCTYANSDPKMFLLVYLINQRDEVFAKYMLPEDDAPLFVRQLLVIKQHPMLSGRRALWPYFNRCICNGCYNRDLANVQLLHADTGSDDIFSAQDDKKLLFSKVIASLHAPHATPYRLSFMAALHWRNFVKKNIARRVQARTELLREDLIAATWHPRRFGNWCLDCDERAELAELFAKK